MSKVYFKCIHCGQIAGYCTETDKEFDEGMAFHTKPEKYGGIPDTVQCALFNQSSSARYWQLHRHIRKLKIDDEILVPIPEKRS